MQRAAAGTLPSVSWIDVVSPLVGKRSFSHETFDHTSIIKAILLRFARHHQDGDVLDPVERAGRVVDLDPPRIVTRRRTHRP